MLKKVKKKKGFTLIELIVVMAVIGILVLLAIPKFMGHTKEAKYTKLISDTKVLEDASERYYMDNQSWPRLNDEPYTAEQVKTFAQKIYNTTGKEVIIDTDGKYYDIDYNQLSKYVNIPDNKESYIIQNPVGSIYALEGLTQEAKQRVSDVKVTGITLDETDVNMVVGENKKLTATIQPANASKTIKWSSSDESIITVDNSGNVTAIKNGIATITAKTSDDNFMAIANITVNAPFSFTQTFNYTGDYQTFIVPQTGKYKLEVWGAQGGNAIQNDLNTWDKYGGLGGYAYGGVSLTQGQTLYVYVGKAGASGNNTGQGSGNPLNNGAWNGGGSACDLRDGAGGGASDIRTVSGVWDNTASLNSRIIVAGGGGGADQYQGNGGSGGGLTGATGVGDLGKSDAYAGKGGTQTAGGVGGSYSNPGQNGGFGYGGGCGISGPGGGGGYYGGGGGTDMGGGGGGSSYYGTLLDAGTTAGVQSGNGKAVITYVGP